MMQTDRQMFQYTLRETDGFSDFIEARRDPRCDVALGAHSLFWGQVAVRITGQVATQIKPLAARTACEPGKTKFRGQGGRDDTGPRKPIPQARVLVIDGTQRADLGDD